MFQKTLFGLAVTIVAVLAVAPAAGAQSVTQGYEAGETLQNGMIVKLHSDTKGDNADRQKSKVIALTQENELQMLGVVVPPADSPVSISDPDKQQVFIATTGQYTVLVSTQNGAIKAGDTLTISSLKGVAMKSDTKHQVILGKALQNFSDGANASSRVTIGGNTSKKQVALGRILVDIGVIRNPAYSGDAIAGVPQWLNKAAQAVSGKPLTALRLYACLAVLFVSIVVAGGILFAGARSGLMAVGRNPLAKKSIFKSMITVVFMAIIIVTIGVIAVYLLLKV